jgi:hypothetical protein
MPRRTPRGYTTSAKADGAIPTEELSFNYETLMPAGTPGTDPGSKGYLEAGTPGTDKGSPSGFVDAFPVSFS